MSARLDFNALAGGEEKTLRADIGTLVIAGWTGRDREAVEKHIRELEAIGVRRPRTTPMFYRAAASLLTQAPRIEVAGTASTGEVEVVLVSCAGALWVGVGSDHTDRELERQSVTLSKQVCAKAVSTRLWRYADVAPHWDELTLTSYAHVRGERRRYQHGVVSALRRPDELIRAWCGSETLPDGTLMFCGTLPVRGEIEFAQRFEIELADPRRGRSLRHAYDVAELPLEH